MLLLQRLEHGPGHRHLPDAEGLLIEYRLENGDLPAIGDAIAEAARELEATADGYYHATGDGGMRHRLRALQAARQQRVCTRD